MRRRCGGVGGGGGGRERGRGGRWEREIVELPGLQSLSVILCVSQPIPRHRRRYSIAQMGEYSLYTLAHIRHTFSHPINTSWKLEISLFILCHSLIRFHHHSNPFSLHIFSISYLTHTLSPHCRPSGCFPGNSCFLFVCLCNHGGRGQG